MALKLFLSDYTYRTDEQQLSALRAVSQLKDAPVFSPDDLQTMFRPTQRVERDTYYAASIACFAPNEMRFEGFLGLCRKKKVCLASIEEGFSWTPQQSTGGAVKAWKAARINGSAKVGALISASNREAEKRAACAKIKDRWPLPRSDWETDSLLKEADISYNTAIKYLGRRPIEQANYQAALKRKARRQKAKAA